MPPRKGLLRHVVQQGPSYLSLCNVSRYSSPPDVYLAPQQRHQGLGGRVVQLHLQLVEEGEGAPQRHHGAHRRDIQAGLGGGEDREGQQGQPDRQAGAHPQAPADHGLQVAEEPVGKLGVEDVEEDGQADDGGADVTGFFLRRRG